MSKKILKQIKELYPNKIIKSIEFDWGEQHWLEMESDPAKVQPIVSIVAIYPMQEQLNHPHFGYHEIIIGLKGQSTHWCDDRKMVLNENAIGYINSEGHHHLINFSNEPAYFISIIYSAIPKSLTELSPIEDVEFSKLSERININLLVRNFIRLLHIKIFFVDANGQFMVNKTLLPTICQLCIQDSCGNCMLVNPALSQSETKEPKTFQCPFGVSVYQTPIVVNNRILGYLSCGYGNFSTSANHKAPSKMSAKMKLAYNDLPFISRNQFISVAETLSLVSTSFVRLMISHIKEEELGTYKVSLAEERETQTRLHDTLNQTKLKLLESQVNPHFLFNTLNTISQQAEIDGNEKIASLTYSLSNLLRLSLGKEKSLLTIKEEIDYIKDYLFIQQSRFPNKFNSEIHIDKGIQNIKIPLMSIMVLVENAILHGFQDITTQGILKITGQSRDAKVIIEVQDNGCGVSDEFLEIIRELPNTDYNQINLNGIGIKNIFLRLKHYYGDDFTLTFERPVEGGTLARIVMPL